MFDVVQLPPAAQRILANMHHPETLTASSLQGLAILRDPAQFNWSVITLFVLVLMVYANEYSKKNYSVILGGLAFWGMDWFNEIWNALWFFFTERAPVWGAPGGGTSGLLLIGLNVEITLMFAVLGVAAAKLLPQDRNVRMFGMNNRLALAIGGSIAACIIESCLNAAGALTWEWRYWQASFPFLLFLIGYMPFFLACYWVHDLPTLAKQVKAVVFILGFDLVCFLVFGCGLHWI